ncbi:MAG: hypothetical protein COA49_06960 [Bacteroidetes bacterium]|nr:MAG: hypothetical protein COA49_06960 [Bacteroidota bacterium]
MNKTISINISGLVFNIEIDAYESLEKYLNALKLKFQNEDGGDEIISDIESRIAELFQSRLSDSKEVLDMDDLNYMISLMGQPDSYENDSDSKSSKEDDSSGNDSKRFFRDTEDKLIGGVASGLSHYFGIDPVILRVIFVLMLLSGFGILFYIVLWIVMPGAKSTSDKLRMRKKKVNVNNIFSEKNTNLGKEYTRNIFDKIIHIIGEILRVLGRIFRYVFGAVFLIWAISLVIVAIYSIFGIGLAFDTFTILTVSEMIDLYVPSPNGLVIAIVGMSISIISFIFLLFYLAVVLLRNRRGSFHFVLWMSPVLIVLGLIISSFGIVPNLIHFNDSHQTREIVYSNFTKGDTLSLSFNNNLSLGLPLIKFNDDVFDGIKIKDEKVYSSSVSVCYRPTTKDTFSVEIVRESNGKSELAASGTTNAIDYEVVIDSNNVNLPSYLGFPLDDGFRNQHVTVNLLIPNGLIVMPDSSAKSTISYYHHDALVNQDGSLIRLNQDFAPIDSSKYKKYIFIY